MNAPVIEPLPLSEHRLLTPAQCRELGQRVRAVRNEWIPRGRYFTLGTASYLDANGQYAQYLEGASKTNPLLRENFAHIYDLLGAFFEDFLFEQVRIGGNLAVPGFHIFEFDGSVRDCGRPSDRAHFDLQWMHAFPSRNLRGRISFTLAVEQPTGGSALEVWPLRYNRELRLIGPINEYARMHRSRRIAYTDGSLLIHDGDILHAIGNSEIPNPDGQRITLQGHGALVDGGWVLYW